jgi:hypothetical protein
MGRDINTISYALTTHCNMRCPDCCAGITALPKSLKSFYSWEYIVESAKYFKGIRRINLTGGEPSVHPKFEEWVPKMKELFEIEVLSVWTNGTMFRKKPEVWQYFDEIHISNYTKDSFDGAPDNTEDIKFIKELYPDKYISATPVIHESLSKRGTKMCFRGYSDTVEFVDGYVYPCCAGSGLNTKVRYKLDENWKEEVLKLHPPCNECLFAEI